MFMTYDKNFLLFFSKHLFSHSLFLFLNGFDGMCIYISEKRRDSFYRIETIIIEDDVLLPDDGKYQLSFGLLF